MVWRKRACVTGALLLCTSVLLAASQPQHERRSKSQVVGPDQKIANVGTVKGITKTAQVTVSEADAAQHAAAPTQPVATVRGDARDIWEGMSQEEVAKVKALNEVATVGQKLSNGGHVYLRDGCAECGSPYADLGLPGTTEWGETISADCSVDGKWYASFTGIAGDIYHFDMCTNGTSSADLDIKILNSGCTILDGVDGLSTCNYNPSNFTWECPVDGTYYAVIAPYNSYSSFTCGGDATDTFTLAYYREEGTPPPTGACCDAATGACEVVVEALCDGPHLTYMGDATTCGVGTCPAPCELTCTGTAEGDACDEDTNSGCNADPYAFDTIALGDTICGTASTSNGLRDTDWYELVIAEATEITVNLYSEFPGTVYLLSGSCDDIDNAVIHGEAYSLDCSLGTASACVPAGTYVIFVSTGDASDGIYDGWPCGTSNDYQLEVTGAPCEVPYCDASGGCDEYIEEVIVGDIDNISACDGYADFTDVATTGIQIGVDLPIQVINGTSYSSDKLAIWVDWNQDRTFDASERVSMDVDSGYGPYSGTLTAPVGAVLGKTRMRVRLNYSSYPEPCGTTTYGDVEDYGIIVLPAPPTGACCLGMVCTNGDVTEDHCVNDLGGIYQGDGSDCDPNPCAGACCFMDGSCSLELEEDCAVAGGSYSGDGTDCEPNECPQPGAECGNPVSVTLGLADLPYVDNNSNCGMGDNYDDTSSSHCMYYYDGGEDIIYEVNITEAMHVTITLDPGTSTYTGVGIGTTCPPTDDANCSASYLSSAGVHYFDVELTPGTYYIMIDTWPSPECIADYTLTISAYAIPTGRCCLDPWPACEDAVTEAYCNSNGGVWTEGADCTANPCPFPAAEYCDEASVIAVLPFSAEFDNDEYTADGPDATCDEYYPTTEGVMQNDAWFTWTATADCDAILTAATSESYDIVMAVRDGCDASANELYCADVAKDDKAQSETIVFAATNGTTYYFQIGDTGSYEGGGVTLLSFDCSDGVGACCFGDGTCAITGMLACMNSNGVYNGDGTTCEADTCVGACCMEDGSCEVLGPQACVDSNGVYSGNGTGCDPNECPQPEIGDNCGLAWPIELPAEMGVIDTNGYTCGRGNSYSDTCLGSYDGGEDIVYDITATEDICVDISVASNNSENWIGVALSDECPLGELCIAANGSSSATSVAMEGLVLVPGVDYSLMIDTYPSPDCLSSFTLAITESTACGVGACCLGTPECVEMFEESCIAAGGTYAGDGTVCGSDCDADGVMDICALLAGEPDCNGNAIPDSCDITAGTSADLDGNGVPDECDPDCNGNSIPDGLDIMYGTSEDCQPDGIPDECQLGGKAYRDMTYALDDGTHEDSLGVTAGADHIAIHHFVVADGAQTIDSISVAWGAVTAGVDATVYLWSDPNGDGSPADAVLLASAPTITANVDQDIFNDVPITPTTVGAVGTSFFVGVHLVSNEYCLAIDETSSSGEAWIVGDTGYNWDPTDVGSAAYSIPLQTLDAAGFPGNFMVRAHGVAAGSDCNNNQVPDDCDIADDPTLDCDTNGVIDACEAGDCDGNGKPDNCDLLEGAEDCNANAVLDKCELNDGTDCDGSGFLDECEIAEDPSLDCNGNGVIDLCDMVNCLADPQPWCDDCNNNGILDACELDGGGKARAVVISEGFEGVDFPPTGWAIENVDPETWILNTDMDYVHSGVQSATHPWSADDAADSYLLTPELTMTSGQVTLWSQGSVGASWSDNYDIDVVIVVGAAGGGDDIYVGNLNEQWVNNSEWTEHTFDLTPLLPGGPFRLAFHYYGFDGDLGMVDDVVIEELGVPSNDCDQNGIPDDCQICGDLDNDDDVDYQDYQLFRSAFGSVEGSAAFNPCVDYDDTGAIGTMDFAQWLTCYRAFIGNPTAGPPTAISSGHGTIIEGVSRDTGSITSGVSESGAPSKAPSRTRGN